MATNPRAKRRRRTSAEIDRILEDYRRSHLTQREYARSHNIPLSTFSRWLRQRRRQEHTAVTGSPESSFSPAPFIPVEISTPAAPASQEYELSLPGGVRLHIPPDFDGDSLSRLLAVLRSC